MPIGFPLIRPHGLEIASWLHIKLGMRSIMVAIQSKAEAPDASKKLGYAYSHKILFFY